MPLRADLQRVDREIRDNDPSQCDDQDLLSLYDRSKDNGYLTEIVKRYHPLVISIVRRNVISSHDVQDGVQATFLILVKSAAKIRRRTSLAAWLHGVAYRTARRIRDRSQRVRHMQTIDAVDDVTLYSSDESPLTSVTKKIQLDVLDEELQLLRETYRSVLIEHYLLGRSAADIAATCNLSQSTVEGRLRRGRQQLRLRMLRRGFGVSAAVAVSSQFMHAEQVAAGELTALVEQVSAYSAPHTTDIPTSVSTLIAEELSMSSSVSSKLLLAILMGSISTAALGLLAVTAVGEQPGQTKTTTLASVPPKVAPPANTIAPDGSKSAAKGGEIVYGEKAKRAEAWPSPVTNRVQQALNIMVQDIAYNAMPLQQVMDGLSDDFRIPFFIDSNGLKSVGIEVDYPITLNMPATPLSQVFDYILSPLALSYRVEGDVLLISSRDQLDKRPNLRVYDFSIFEDTGIHSVVAQQIRKIQPELWEAETWSIDSLDNQLMLISASDPAHAEIERMLGGLARQLGKQLPQKESALPATSKLQKKGPATLPTDDPFGGSTDPFK